MADETCTENLLRLGRRDALLNCLLGRSTHPARVFSECPPAASRRRGCRLSTRRAYFRSNGWENRHCDAASHVAGSLARANGLAEALRYFGRFESEAEAKRWIAEHLWLTKQNFERRADPPGTAD
jgi:hypothetical protein